MGGEREQVMEGRTAMDESALTSSISGIFVTKPGLSHSGLSLGTDEEQ